MASNLFVTFVDLLLVLLSVRIPFVCQVDDKGLVLVLCKLTVRLKVYNDLPR